MIRDRIDPSKIAVVPTRYGRMMVLENDRYMGQAMIRHGEYSESEVELWRQLLPPQRWPRRQLLPPQRWPR